MRKLLLLLLGSGLAAFAQQPIVDTTTIGNWKGVYGGDGCLIADDTNIGQGPCTLPAYTQFNITGASAYTWGRPADVPRALQPFSNSPLVPRWASTWYAASSFTLDVNLTDGAPHQVAIYFLDYDNNGRTELVELLDGSGNVLGSQIMSNFMLGKYLVWNLSGRFKIKVTRQGGANAIASAIFIGSAPPSSAQPTLSVSATTLSFGAAFNSVSSSAPQTVNISNAGGGTLSWSAVKTAPWLSLAPSSGTAPSAMSVSVNPSGMAAGSYTDTITINGAGSTKTIAVTMNVNSSASVSFVNSDTTNQGWWKTSYGTNGFAFVGETASIPPYAQFSVNGASQYIWADNIAEIRALQHSTGNYRIASVWYETNGFNFDVNFTDGAIHRFALYATDYESGGRSEKIEILDFSSGNVLDTQTLSSFYNGQYLIWNISGHVIVRVTKLGGPNAIIGGVFFDPPGVPPTQPVLSLSAASLNFASPAGGANPASQKVTISNNGGGSLSWTASENASWLSLSSTSGTAPADLTFNISNAGLAAGTYTENVSVAGIGASGSPKTVAVTFVVAPVVPTSATASFVGGNSFLGGNWSGNYGSDGTAIYGQTTAVPSYVQMSVSGASLYTWFSSTTSTKALQYVSGSGRIAACWYSFGSFTYDLNFSGGQHRFTLYATDFDNQNRVERIDIVDSDSGNVLDTRQLAGFQNGVYMSWNVSGHILVKVTSTGGSSLNAVVSGLFFDPVPVPALVISSNNISFTGTTGTADPIPQNIALANPAGTVLNWTASESAPWLSLSATSGTTPGSLNLMASLAGLAAGTYTTQLTIASPGVVGSPQTVNVTFNVTEAPVVDALPLGFWTFDANTISGNTVRDVTPNHLDGTLQGGANGVTFENGPNGTQVAVFNGASGYITTRNDPREAIQNDLTLSAWIRTTNSSRTETIIAKYNLSGNEDGYMFETTANGYLAMHFGRTNTGAIQDYVDGNTKINDGGWHHVAAIIRPSQDLQFYVDGGLSSVFYITIGGGGYSPMLTIGGPVLFGQNFFTGSMEEVMIYPRALTTKEIATFTGRPVLTSAAGELLYNGINLPKNFPPQTTPTQEYRTPYYINNPPRVIPIDVGRQLFVDDFLVENTTLQRTQHQAEQQRPVLQPGVPISGGAWWNPTGNKYELFYWDALAPLSESYRYAYSTDGLNWIKPTFSDTGVWAGTNAVNRHGDTIWLDLEDPDPGRRYKAFGIDPGAGSDLGKIYVYFSPDGIHWGPRLDYGIISISDRTSVFYNAFRKVWVNSDRGAVGLPATDKVPANNSRARYYSESKDLINWNPANPQNTFWTAGDENDPPYYPGGEPQELYNLDAVAYESVMVGLFSWFHPGIGYRDYTRPGPILVEVGVGFSRDGFSWVRPTRASGPNGAFISASNIAGTWNAFNTQSVGGGFLVVGDELWFYFSARTLQKPLDGSFTTGLAKLRRDGFYSMDAGSTAGTLTTRPVKFSGNRMFVNVKNPTGTLLIEAQDENGNVIPGFESGNFVPVTQDKTSYEVRWNGANLGTLAGRNVKFKFTLTNGSLYSFWVTSSPVGASNGYVAAGGPNFTTLTDTPAGGNGSACPAVLLTPAPGSTLGGSQATFTWNSCATAQAYFLDVGTALGQGNIFGQNVGLATSQIVSNIPTTGQTIYVQVWSLIAGTWNVNRYTLTAGK